MEIAGSPRNAFRDSLMHEMTEVKHWMGAGGSNPTKPNQTLNAVIAITSDNGDLQGELNLVWERILPVL